MIVKLYSIMDIVAKEFGPIFQAKNDNVASRSFKKTVENGVVNPDELRIYCLADFDTEAGMITDVNRRYVEFNMNEEE